MSVHVVICAAGVDAHDYEAYMWNCDHSLAPAEKPTAQWASAPASADETCT